MHEGATYGLGSDTISEIPPATVKWLELSLFHSDVGNMGVARHKHLRKDCMKETDRKLAARDRGCLFRA